MGYDESGVSAVFEAMHENRARREKESYEAMQRINREQGRAYPVLKDTVQAIEDHHNPIIFAQARTVS